jgi:hypothetical protein
VRWLKEVSVPELLFAFEMLYARAFVDSHVKPLEELNRRIAMIEKVMPKTVDFIRKDASPTIYDGINRIYEKSVKEADIRKRYFKLELAYLLALLYLAVRLKTYVEEAEKYLKTYKKA